MSDSGGDGVHNRAASSHRKVRVEEVSSCFFSGSVSLKWAMMKIMQRGDFKTRSPEKIGDVSLCVLRMLCVCVCVCLCKGSHEGWKK